MSFHLPNGIINIFLIRNPWYPTIIRRFSCVVPSERSLIKHSGSFIFYLKIKHSKIVFFFYVCIVLWLFTHVCICVTTTMNMTQSVLSTPENPCVLSHCGHPPQPTVPSHLLSTAQFHLFQSIIYMDSYSVQIFDAGKFPSAQGPWNPSKVSSV